MQLNSNLGYYTNFMNLLDLAAIAVPAGFQRDGLPFGVTLAAPAFTDEALCVLGDIAQRAMVKTMGATGLPFPGATAKKRVSRIRSLIRVAVCGAHMSGLPLNGQLVERGARLARNCRTAPHYRLYALTEFAPPRPGMVRADAGARDRRRGLGSARERVRQLRRRHPGAARHRHGDARGRHSRSRAFFARRHATQGARDITSLGGWRQFIEGGKA